MHVLPFIQCRTIPAEFIIQYECSDRLLVAKNIQASYALYSTPCLLRITNNIDTYVVGTIYGFHEEDDILYMPMWMMNILKTTQRVTIACIPTQACTKLSIKPYNSGLFEISEWDVKLRNGLRLYSSLTKGNMIPINIDGLVYFTVEMLYPQSYDTVYLIGSGEMEVDIRPSVELEHAVRKQILVSPIKTDYSQVPYLVSIPHTLRKHALYDTLNVFGGTAHTISTVTGSLRGPGEAARRRMNKG